MKTQIQVADSSTEAQRKRVQFMTAVFYGTLVGVLVGILAMAVGVLFISMLSLFMDTAVLQLPGMSMTAITFVTFFFLGTVAAIFLIWRKIK
ncbi:MAG: hypothetical protein H6659_15025 [Ardenticatenaceae bacterium]|nr:hypothetical protein [Ardenticatenaceae bacterium]MCB8986685.1 hypothetical protein [Ardenticatenaceae bacterium]